ncbi:MAG: NUDIX hydrolase [Fervidicoccaceae archaeon]
MSCRPQVGVGVLVFDERGRILLVRRGHPPGAGLWSLPGGRVEEGERVFDAARRELLEEAGIDGEPRAIVDVNELVVRRPSGELAYHYVLLAVLVEPRSLEARPGGDAVELDFFEVERALALPDLSPSTRALLTKMLSGRRAEISPVTVQITEAPIS